MNPIKTDAVIIGAGPAGLHAAFQLGLQGIQSHIVEALPHIGGQCVELYKDKLIYDIPAIKACTGEELATRLYEQALPFKPTLHLNTVVTHILPIQAKGVEKNNGNSENNESSENSKNNNPEAPSQPNLFSVHLSQGQIINARCVVIATGTGAFLPRSIKLDGLDALPTVVQAGVEQQVFYTSTRDFTALKGKHIVISGDLDETLQMANALAQQKAEQNTHQPARVTLIHRRDKFRADENTIALTDQLIKQGHLKFVAAQPLGIKVNANNKMIGLDAKESASQEISTLNADALFMLHGVAPKLQDFSNWGVQLNGKQIAVDTSTYQTNLPGVFAIGDTIHYAGKRKLILSTFHEAALMAYAAASYIQGGVAVPQIYTTSSTKLQGLLDV